MESFPKSTSPAWVRVLAWWTHGPMMVFWLERAASDPPLSTMPAKLRSVPAAKKSYQPPIWNTGTVTSSYRSSTASALQ